MKSLVVAAALLTALCVAHTARADDHRLDLFALGTILEPVDVLGFTAGDTFGHDHGLSYGIIETSLNAPVAIGVGYYAVTSNSSDRPLQVGVAVVNGLLAAHGVYTIVKALRHGDEHEPAMLHIGSVRANVVPVAAEHATGFGLGGTF
jgi:hypothetical protein